MTAERIIAGNLKLTNYRPEDAWECSRRASKEQNFFLMMKSFIEQRELLLENSKSVFVTSELSSKNSRSWKQ